MMPVTTWNLVEWQKNHFEGVEGRAKHFYLDGEDIVTAGIGCVVTNRGTTLPMRWKANSIRATVDDIGREYDAIQMLPKGKTPSFYDTVCRLYLADEDIDALFQQRLTAFIQSVEDSICNLSGFPELAALVLIDMAFNLGVSGLARKFPKFLNAFLAKDWKVAALECKREGVQSSRNTWARTSLESLITFQA